MASIRRSLRLIRSRSRSRCRSRRLCVCVSVWKSSVAKQCGRQKNKSSSRVEEEEEEEADGETRKRKQAGKATVGSRHQREDTLTQRKRGRYSDRVAIKGTININKIRYLNLIFVIQYL